MVDNLQYREIISTGGVPEFHKSTELLCVGLDNSSELSRIKGQLR